MWVNTKSFLNDQVIWKKMLAIPTRHCMKGNPSLLNQELTLIAGFYRKLVSNWLATYKLYSCKIKKSFKQSLSEKKKLITCCKEYIKNISNMSNKVIKLQSYFKGFDISVNHNERHYPWQRGTVANLSKPTKIQENINDLSRKSKEQHPNYHRPHLH